MIEGSLYDQLQASTVTAKQRVVERFLGASLDERWTQVSDGGGTPVFTTVDTPEEGFEIDSDSAAGNDGGRITFNDIRQYDFNASACISVMRTLETASTMVAVGLADNMFSPTSGTGGFAIMAFDTDFSTSFFAGKTHNGTTETETATSIAVDTNFHNFKSETQASAVKQTLDGILVITMTTTLPSAKLQPEFLVTQRSTTHVHGHIRYFEAYNI